MKLQMVLSLVVGAVLLVCVGCGKKDTVQQKAKAKPPVKAPEDKPVPEPPKPKFKMSEKKIDGCVDALRNAWETAEGVAALYKEHPDWVNAYQESSRMTGLLTLMSAGKTNVAVLEEMKKVGVDVNLCDCLGQSPLFHSQKVESTKWLLANGADVNAADVAGNTALMSASTGELVEVLVAAGAKPNQKSNGGLTAMAMALKKGRADVVKALLKHGAKVTGNEVTYAVGVWTKPDAFKVLFESGVDVNIKSEAGQTALHEAARFTNVAMVTYLLEAKADPTIKNNFDETPLDLVPKDPKKEKATKIRELIKAKLAK